MNHVMHYIFQLTFICYKYLENQKHITIERLQRQFDLQHLKNQPKNIIITLTCYLAKDVK